MLKWTGPSGGCCRKNGSFLCTPSPLRYFVRCVAQKSLPQFVPCNPMAFFQGTVGRYLPVRSIPRHVPQVCWRQKHLTGVTPRCLCLMVSIFHRAAAVFQRVWFAGQQKDPLQSSVVLPLESHLLVLNNEQVLKTFLCIFLFLLTKNEV